MSLGIDGLNRQQLVARIFDGLAEGRAGWVTTPNVDILRLAHRDSEIKHLLSRATLVIADGAPVEWAARLSGREIPGRLPGASMFWVLADEAAQRNRTLLLLGGRPTAAELAARRLSEAYPGLVVHHHCPPIGFENDPYEMEAIRVLLRTQKPDLVFVGLGAPKQERLMLELHEDFGSSWFFGFGAAIDFAAGLVPRAPIWMQEAGLEWVFRLAVEPRRLAKRYLVLDIPFAIRLLAWALAARMRPQVPLVPRQRGAHGLRRGWVVPVPHSIRVKPAPPELDAA